VFRAFRAPRRCSENWFLGAEMVVTLLRAIWSAGYALRVCVGAEPLAAALRTGFYAPGGAVVCWYVLLVI
jgi:hypothetical protein